MGPGPEGEEMAAHEDETGGSPAAGARPVAHIVQGRCDGSAGCPVSRVCPKRAVARENGAEQPGQRHSRLALFGFRDQAATGWKIDENKCTGCLLCAQYCPHGAVKPRERRVA